jgi:hypothetical protein
MDVYTFFTTVVFGIGVLVSYALVFAKEPSSGGYAGSRMWLGYPRPVIYMLMVLQLLAVVGFVAMMLSWIITPPSGGLLGKHRAVLPAVVAVTLLASTVWAPATQRALTSDTTASKVAVVASLVVAAVGSILLVAGAAEEHVPRVETVLGSVAFAATTVLADAVAWNARFILT